MKVKFKLLVALLAVVAFTGCSSAHDAINEPGYIAGFWAGLFDGMFLIINFLVSLFDYSYKIYNSTNSGHLYDLGFMVGVFGVGAIGMDFFEGKKES